MMIVAMSAWSGRYRGGVSVIPLNMEPIAPFLSNTLEPVPVVFSPAAGLPTVSYSTNFQKREDVRSYDLVGRFMNATRQILILHGGIGALLKCLRRVVTVH